MLRKTFITFAAALLAVMLLGTNDARAFLIDGFGDSQTSLDAFGELGAEVCDEAGDPGNCLLTDTVRIGLTDTDLVDTTAVIDQVKRTFSGIVTDSNAVLLSNLENFDFGVGGGKLIFQTGIDIQAIGMVTWTDFDTFSISGTTIVLDVDINLGTGPGSGVLSLELMDSSNETALASFTIVSAGIQIINLTNAMFLADNGSIDLADIVKVKLTVDGSLSRALDLSIDIIETIPEPATLALFGIGLLGLGFMSRRRRLWRADGLNGSRTSGPGNDG